MTFEQIVMAGLDPAIHGFGIAWIEARKGVDHRVKPDDDDSEWWRRA
jgi:hypothetical protein